jgi:hypothetical protein
VNFRLPIDLGGSRVVRTKTFLNSRVQGIIFDVFGDKVSNAINRVFSKSCIGGGRENIKKLRIIVEGIHDNRGITFSLFPTCWLRIIYKTFSNPAKS